MANDRESERGEKISAKMSTGQFHIKIPAGSFSLVLIYEVSMKSVNYRASRVSNKNKNRVVNVLGERRPRPSQPDG
jgi:hypothetical protein